MLLKITQKKGIYCLGHITLDIFIHRSDLNKLKIGGQIESQELGVYGGGCDANVSFWLGILKNQVSLTGVIANDPAGNFLRTELEHANVKCRLKYSEKYPTATILIVVEPDGERSFIRNGECLDDLEWEDLQLEYILNSNLFYTSAYTLESLPIKETVKHLFQTIRKNEPSEPLTMLNLAAYTTVERRRSEIEAAILPYTSILVGNRDEFDVLVNNRSDKAKKSNFEIAKKICDNFPNLKTILITLGANGCFYYSENNHGHIPTSQISVVDTTGAGDGFCAGFIDGYLAGKNIEQAVKQGVNLGTQICQGFGARFNASKFSF
ncbi:MAG: carbohydrate kinase family protein [Candidatus Hermodarchaeota archaeon]